jgi:hypothetical protein
MLYKKLNSNEIFTKEKCKNSLFKIVALEGSAYLWTSFNAKNITYGHSQMDSGQLGG